MAKLKWVGIKEWDAAYPQEPLPQGARPLRCPDPLSAAALPYGLLPLLACFGALFGKARALGQFPLNPWLIPAGILLGLLLIPVHEVLHGICFPAGYTVYIGVAPKKLAAFAVCHSPISRGRFIFMSLLPMVLGAAPLVLFLLAPGSWRGYMGICWPMAVMGLLSPMPDYMNTACVLRQVPKGARVQTTNDGFWFFS